jgi:hypothetical protein
LTPSSENLGNFFLRVDDGVGLRELPFQASVLLAELLVLKLLGALALASALGAQRPQRTGTSLFAP